MAAASKTAAKTKKKVKGKRKRLGYTGLEAIVTGGRRANSKRKGGPIDVVTLLTRYNEIKRQIDAAMEEVGGDAAKRVYEPPKGVYRYEALAAARVVYATILMAVRQMREKGIAKSWMLSAQGLRHVMMQVQANLKILHKLDDTIEEGIDMSTNFTISGFGCMRSIVYGIIQTAVRYDVYENRLKSAFMGYAHAAVLTLASLIMRAHRAMAEPFANLPYTASTTAGKPLQTHRNRLRIDNAIIRPITNRKDSARKMYLPIMKLLGGDLRRSRYEKKLIHRQTQTRTTDSD